jgi:hypothetical protein
MRRLSIRFASAVCCLCLGLVGCARPQRIVEEDSFAPTAAAEASAPPDLQITRAAGKVEIVSQPYDIDRPYLPMLGPKSSSEFRLQEESPAELVWITGAHVRMVDSDAKETLSDHYLCRAELSLDSQRHSAIFGIEEQRPDCVLALGRGQLDLEFPSGHGIPIRSDEMLTLTTQAQNLDFAPERKPVQVRQRVTFDVARQRDLPQPLAPLYFYAISGFKSLESRPVVYDDSDQFPDATLQPAAGSPGVAFVDSQWGDRFAHQFTDHWVLEPGREENHTRVTTLLDLIADKTIHYIGAHLHPYAESIELVDLSTGETVYKGLGGQANAEGLPLVSGHEYVLKSIYDNTSGSPQNAMATLYLYLLDPQFKLPAEQPAAKP